MDNVIHFVYCLTFTNGKVYIGMSRTHPRHGYLNRYREHKSKANNGKQLPIYNAWRKHGDPIQTILSMHESREECAKSEINAITEYGSINKENGYNLCPGGEGLNAPKGSAIYELMKKKVWENPERRKKVSAALKGRQPSEQTRIAYKKWRAENSEYMREILKNVWKKDGYREIVAERTRQQMANGGAKYLSDTRKGRPDHLSPEARLEQGRKLKILMNTDRGKEIARKGQAIMWSNPDNRQKWMDGTAAWRATDRNKEQCKEMAKLSAAKCSRKVKLADSDEIFDSQRKLAKMLNVSEATITHWLKSGKAVRIS